MDLHTFAGRQWNVEGGRDGSSRVEHIEHGLVTSLDSQDGGSAGQEHGVRNKGSSSHVRRNADVLDDSGNSGHGGDISEYCVEVECASGHWLSAKGPESGLQGGSDART